MPKNKENDLLRSRFRKLKYETICEFARSTGSEVSEETWTSVFHRNSSPSLKTLLIMASELGFSHEEIIDLLTARGENAIARLIERTSLSVKDKNLIGKMKLLADKDPKKVALIHEMVNNLLK